MEKSIYSKDYKYLVKRLKDAREDIGFNQKRIAKLLGRTQSYISKIESGQIKIDILQLREFARIYKKDIEFFLK